MKQERKVVVLMADDDDDDCMLAREAIEESDAHVILQCVDNGINLMEHLLNADRLPALILLDLNMPKKDGRQALREIKAVPALRDIPIVVFTTSREEKDVEFSRKMGADSFVTKPDRFSEWVGIMQQMIQTYVCRQKN